MSETCVTTQGPPMPAAHRGPLTDYEQRWLATVTERLSNWRSDDHEDNIVLSRHEVVTLLEALSALSPASDARRTNIVTCCVTGAIPGDGGACGDCDPCILGESSVPAPVKRLIAEKNSLLNKIDELSDKLATLEETAPRTEGAEAVALIETRIKDLREANEIFLKSPRDTERDRHRNEREIMFLRDLRSTLSAPAAPAQKGEVVLVWNEPLWGPKDGGICGNSVVRSTPAEVIAYQKARFPDRNYTDDDALHDFIVTNWAWYEHTPTPQAADAVREAFEAGVRAARLAIFALRKAGAMPNSSWESGFNADLETAERGLAALSTAGGEWRTMVELHKFVTDHFANQDMNHLDFRVEAYRIIATHAPVSGEILDQSDSSGTEKSSFIPTVEER